MKIELEIGALRLRGVAQGDGQRVAAGMEQELTRLLSSPGFRDALRKGRHGSSLQAPDVIATPAPRELGHRIGQAVGATFRPAAESRS